MLRCKAVAVATGPEFGTVGPEHVREAAKEVVRFADLLVVCGFGFDPLAGEEASALGRLTVLQARMNPDLGMGDELLLRQAAPGPQGRHQRRGMATVNSTVSRPFPRPSTGKIAVKGLSGQCWHVSPRPKN